MKSDLFYILNDLFFVFQYVIPDKSQLLQKILAAVKSFFMEQKVLSVALSHPQYKTKPESHCSFRANVSMGVLY